MKITFPPINVRMAKFPDIWGPDMRDSNATIYNWLHNAVYNRKPTICNWRCKECMEPLDLEAIPETKQI